jgi:hypothetical protein
MDIDPRLVLLLKEFGASIGLTDVAFNDDGYCGLTFDGAVTVNLQAAHAAPRVRLYALAGDVDESRRAEVFEAMLRANLFGAGTSGAALSLEGDPPRAVLEREVVCDGLTGEDLAAEVERFVEAVEDWTAYVSGSAPDEDSPDGHDHDEAIPGLMRV